MTLCPCGNIERLVRASVVAALGSSIACGNDDGGRVADGETSSSPTSTSGSDADDGSTAVDDGGPTGDVTGTPSTTSPDPTTGSPATSTGDSGGSESDGGPAGSCPDGTVDPGEACDDDNAVDVDGCNTDCTVSGSVLWSHSQAGGVGQAEDGYGIAVAADEAAFVAGDLASASRDLWLRQYTPAGGLGWTVVTDGPAAAADGWLGLARRDDTLYATGYRATATGNDIFVASYATDGSAGWTSSYDDPISGSDIAYGVAVDPDGNVIIAGTAAADLEGANVIVQKLTPAGGVTWTQFYTSAGAVSDQGRGVAADFAGNIVAVGFETVGGQVDLWVRKYDPAGTTLWTQGFAGVDGLDDRANAVTTMDNGDVIVAGRESSVAVPSLLWLRRYDLNGNTQWTQTFAGSAGEGAEAFGVVADAAGDIVVVGRETVGGFDRVLVRKYADDGTVRWTETIEGAADTSSVGRAITVGPDQHLWIAAGVDKGVDGRDVYVAKVAR